MNIDPNAAKMYLRDPSKAILDIRKGLYTESDIQLLIDEVYKELDPSYNKMSIYFKMFSGWYLNAPKIVVSQNYLDEVIKPFINKVNTELNWNLRTPVDFMT